ncbi:extracellular solute-binding protein [Nocardia rhizosphaerae]|uniref:Extracellular solute-binding protein n=1 Tax=Nocardia rhizosphaerae TaxID=1691571 RepID=A0ABV8L4M9_9NOCA
MRSYGGKALVAAIVLALGACASPPGAADTIVVYSAQEQALAQAWARGFTTDTGIEVILRDGADLALADRLIAEGAETPADAFLTENAPALDLVADAGLLADLDRATLDQVPSRYRPPSGRWIGVAVRTPAFVYDTAELSQAELPAGLLELAQPQWQGRWGAGFFGADFQAVVTGLLAARGPELTRTWLRGVRANATSVLDPQQAVADGIMAGGVISHDDWTGPGRTALHPFPDATATVSGGAVLRAGEQQRAAQRFLAFVAGPQGQTILRASTSAKYPVIAAPMPSDPRLGALDPALATRLMTEAGLLPAAPPR